MTLSKRHRVLVVDDSAFARKVLREILSKDDRFEVVGFARDGLDALEKITELDPDVITLDLVMPELDGVGVLDALRERANAPRVVIVTMTDSDSALGVAALEAGAFDIVHKPTALATDRLYELERELVDKLASAANASDRGAVTSGSRDGLGAAFGERPASPPVLVAPSRAKLKTRAVVIGASTGGPRALTEILTALPASFPVPLAIVVHMPVGYTRAFAERLDVASSLRVREAGSGAPLEPGTALIARAGQHMRLALKADGTIDAIVDEDDAFEASLRSSRSGGYAHCPSVDVLFESAARAVGAGALGVVLTGMGQDGLEGARAIRNAGGRLLVESQSSCVVYGMPRAVAEANLDAVSVPLELMAAAIIEHL